MTTELIFGTYGQQVDFIGISENLIKIKGESKNYFLYFDCFFRNVAGVFMHFQ